MARGRPPRRPEVNLQQSLRTEKYNQELDKAFSELWDFARVHARHGPFALQGRPGALTQLAVQEEKRTEHLSRSHQDMVFDPEDKGDSARTGEQDDSQRASSGLSHS